MRSIGAAIPVAFDECSSGIDNVAVAPSLNMFATILVHHYRLEFWVIAANASENTFSRPTSMAADGPSIEAATRRSLSVVRPFHAAVKSSSVQSQA